MPAWGFDLVISVAEKIREWMGTLSERKVRKTAEIRTAVKCVAIAAAESKAYLAGLRRGETVDPERELRLSYLWAEATGALHEVDEELARRCMMKADYWSDREGWTDEELDRHQLKLAKISSRASKLLGA